MAEIRSLDGLAEQKAAARLYRSVFGYVEPEWGLSPRLLAALRENSGTAIGAFDEDGTLIGFCYGFTAVEAGEIYHYSQAAVVAPGAQGGGIGRRLKQAQAAVARDTGARSMRWTFDPYALRNAHFNLMVLGATGIRFHPDFYDEPDTDRIVVSWDLTGAPPARTGMAESVVTPASDRIAAPDPADRSRLRWRLADHFGAGRRLVAVTRAGDAVTYAFENGEP
ncbi:hypothetical protein AMIS_36180 [Actinoplanes missouriensis 431]|uniref:N-acetyltransferase domain-containing protein n=1 Tax=Actinoplanes missouriensis (strain ATCC 14538 / DSM 43046 / CBS 188.64 / JCM 3121 / NBRC 102363 / NCIMB 12654 / NRRL B-3342 / UNCC 431) TaxID=512565 RepID=I0H751_ACTM4|nr:GNAT family N-acetyltransferase [Actinoplanes missouriensis]BAL88838.1 hypothetical protein AMIS_36180 [Actinoplanes missouriensis 431]